MKKLVYLLLAIVLFCPALAAADGAVYHPGDTFEAVFTVTDNPQDAVTVLARLEYDPFIFQPLPSQGLYQNSGVAFSGGSVSVSFQISPLAPAGDYEISMTLLEAGNEKSSGLTVNIPSFRLTVAEDKPAAPEKTPFPEMPAAPEEDFEYAIIGGKASITKYVGPGGDVAIPATLDRYTVGAIGNQAFGYNDSLTSVVIPDSVTSIGDEAFCGCSSLTGVIIPDSVTRIGAQAFRDCSSLSGVTLPDSVASIGDAAFGNCSALTGIDVSSGNSQFASLNGVLFNKIKTTLVAYPKGLSGEYVIPAGVTRIEGGAFYGCSGLTSLTIPDSVTYIGDYAFFYCSGLTGLTIPNSVIYLGDYVFIYCEGLTSMAIPNSVTRIGEGAFCYCGSLTGVIIPDSVTSIGDKAFHYCGSLTGITIPASVKKIGLWAFDDCSSLTGLTLPEGVESIGNYAFFKCRSLNDVTIPASVTRIGYAVFGECTSLTAIHVSSGNTRYVSLNGVLFSKDKSTLIEYPAGLSGEYAIPAGVTRIENSAFQGCSGLTGVAIPDSVTTIDHRAFFWCVSLTSAAIPSSVTSIGSDAFYRCSSNFVITVIKNSYAQQYCIDNNLKYKTK